VVVAVGGVVVVVVGAAATTGGAATGRTGGGAATAAGAISGRDGVDVATRTPATAAARMATPSTGAAIRARRCARGADRITPVGLATVSASSAGR
jgi:hypothetical protein